jgi:hypothetical protein
MAEELRTLAGTMNHRDRRLVNDALEDIEGFATSITTGTLTADVVTTAELNYSDTYWKDILVPFTRDKQGQSSKPDFDFTDLGLLFPQNNENEEVYLILQVNHDYALGTNLHPHIHYIQDEAGIPKFELTYRWQDNGDTVGGWTTIESNVAAIFPYTSGAIRQILGFPAIDGSGISGVSSMLDVIIRRQTGDGIAGDVLTKELDFHYEIDGPGSRDEYVK